VDFIITDYMTLHTDIDLLSIPKGDATSIAVAAASILAKVTRDDYMIQLDKQYPIYHFAKNKGYGTKDHLLAIENYGYVEGVHRLSFEPVKSMHLGIEQLKLF
jgi:ribonuclease HII